MFDAFYTGKRILVSGLAGAKGAWLGWYLVEAGCERVIGVDNAASLAGTCFEASGLGSEQRVSLHPTDVRDTEGLLRVIEAERPDALVHLAAMAIVGECKDRPLDAYSANVLGTASVLEAVRRSDVRRVLIVTTDKVYRDKDGAAWTEEDPLFATGPYAVSKACADVLARDYFASYLQPEGKHLCVGRAGNVLAPGDHHDGRIFVDVARALGRGEPPVILNPLFSRPYTFVGDVVSGYLCALAACDRPGVDGETFNFGPPEASGTPNGELATMMCELWGTDITWRAGTARHEPFTHQSLDCTKARERLDWRPVYGLRAGLAATVAWYKAQLCHPGPGEMRGETLRIVGEHAEAARAAGVPWAQ